MYIYCKYSDRGGIYHVILRKLRNTDTGGSKGLSEMRTAGRGSDHTRDNGTDRGVRAGAVISTDRDTSAA